MVDKNDPSRKVFEHVARWSNTMLCLPIWEEMREVEYVRQREEINMFTENVQRYCFDRGLYAAVNWYQRCKEAGVLPSQLYSIALADFERKHGPRDGWITPAVKDELESRELDLELQRCEKQLQLLQRRRQAR